jgi:hypothetical protein
MLMYLWSALISGCALSVAFIDGRLLVIGIVSGAMLLAVVLPKLMRDRRPRGSDVARVEGHEEVTPVLQPEAVPSLAEPEAPPGAAAR